MPMTQEKLKNCIKKQPAIIIQEATHW